MTGITTVVDAPDTAAPIIAAVRTATRASVGDAARAARAGTTGLNAHLLGNEHVAVATGLRGLVAGIPAATVVVCVCGFEGDESLTSCRDASVGELSLPAPSEVLVTHERELACQREGSVHGR